MAELLFTALVDLKKLQKQLSDFFKKGFDINANVSGRGGSAGRSGGIFGKTGKGILSGLGSILKALAPLTIIATAITKILDTFKVVELLMNFMVLGILKLSKFFDLGFLKRFSLPVKTFTTGGDDSDENQGKTKFDQILEDLGLSFGRTKNTNEDLSEQNKDTAFTAKKIAETNLELNNTGITLAKTLGVDFANSIFSASKALETLAKKSDKDDNKRSSSRSSRSSRSSGRLYSDALDPEVREASDKLRGRVEIGNGTRNFTPANGPTININAPTTKDLIRQVESRLGFGYTKYTRI